MLQQLNNKGSWNINLRRYKIREKAHGDKSGALNVCIYGWWGGVKRGCWFCSISIYFLKIWDQNNTLCCVEKAWSPTGLNFDSFWYFRGSINRPTSEYVTVFLILLSAIYIQFVWRKIHGNWGWPCFKHCYWKCKAPFNSNQAL